MVSLGAVDYEVLVETSLRPGSADPEGATIERAMVSLGYESCSRVRVGKAIRMRVEAPNEDEATRRVRQLCDRFLTNPVMEDATISIQAAAGAPS